MNKYLRDIIKNIITKILLRPEKRIDYSEEIVRQKMTENYDRKSKTILERTGENINLVDKLPNKVQLTS